MVAMDASMMELMALDHIERLRRARAPRRPGLRAHTQHPLSRLPGCGSGSSFVRASGASRAQVRVDQKVMINGYGILREIQDVEAVVISTQSESESESESVCVCEREFAGPTHCRPPPWACSAKRACAPRHDALATATWAAPHWFYIKLSRDTIFLNEFEYEPVAESCGGIHPTRHTASSNAASAVVWSPLAARATPRAMAANVLVASH